MTWMPDSLGSLPLSSVRFDRQNTRDVPRSTGVPEGLNPGDKGMDPDSGWIRVIPREEARHGDQGKTKFRS